MGFIIWIIAGYITYVLLDKKLSYRTNKNLTWRHLIVLLLSGWFGLGFVVGRYYV